MIWYTRGGGRREGRGGQREGGKGRRGKGGELTCRYCAKVGIFSSAYASFVSSDRPETVP